MSDYIKSLLSLIFAISIMYMLLDCEFKHKRDRYLLGLYASIVLICDGLVLLKFGYVHFMKLYPLLVNIPIVLAFLYFSKFKAIKVLFIAFTVISITVSFSLIGLIIAYFFGFNRVLINVICYLLYLPTGVIIYRYLRPSFLYMLRNTDKGWVGFCTIPLSYIAILFSSSKYNLNTVITERAVVFAVLIFVLTLAAYILILRFFKQTRERLTLQNEQNISQMQLAAAHIHLKALQESQEQTLIYRHDMRHHLNLISAYLKDDNLAAAHNYITKVEETIESAAVETYCSNYSVNLILSSYIANARNEKIEVETQINLPEKNAVADMDLCVIFANAIENAVNACKRIPFTDDRTLKIVCKRKNEKLLIQITNSFDGKVCFVNDMPVNMEENHGLGTKSIAAVADKYNGVYSFTAEDGIFKTSIIL